MHCFSFCVTIKTEKKVFTQKAKGVFAFLFKPCPFCSFAGALDSFAVRERNRFFFKNLRKSVTMEKNKKVYIVVSFSNTLPGRLICTRAKMKFWNRYPGDCYSHVSLSLDSRLDNMMSFARKEVNRPLFTGLIREDIRTGVFALNPLKSNIAVFEIAVTVDQYKSIKTAMELFWKRRDELRYNFLGLFMMLVFGRGLSRQDHYFCSQWVAEIFKNSRVGYFEDRKAYNVRPMDFYSELENHCIYEGNIEKYPLFSPS